MDNFSLPSRYLSPFGRLSQGVKRRIFIWLCVIVSAGLFWLISPQFGLMFFALNIAIILGVVAVLYHLINHPGHRSWLAPLSISVLVALLVLSHFLSHSDHLAQLEIRLFGNAIVAGDWVGFSYLSLRLIHVLVDSKRVGRVPPDALLAYALFPSAVVAGPIHRATQFLPQVDTPHRLATRDNLIDSLWRIALGVAKKLVLANFFGLFALTPGIATNAKATPFMLWLALVGFGFKLYFDFAGYSDIALGTAALVGINLPENFANPYAQPDIARFWQCWHMSLSYWLRDYIFMPVSRTLLRRFGGKWSTPIMGISHLVTMICAGLWHGLNTAFLAWGVWHGLGLFAHAQWSRWAKPPNLGFPRLISILGTFLFVTLGWAFFVLPDFGSSVRFIARLFGR